MQQWEGYKTLIGESTGVHSIDNGGAVTFGSIYTVTKDYGNVKINNETYAIYADSPFSRVTTQADGNRLTVKAENMNIFSNIYNLGNSPGSMIDSIRTYADADLTATLEFNILSDKFTYDLSLSPDKTVLYVTIYYNSLNRIVVGTNNEMDYITLTGNSPWM